MIAIFWFTAFLILLYLLYPLWLFLFFPGIPVSDKETDEITGVSLILLSFNGKKYLEEKINFLMKELSAFQHFELIIVDDNSTDGSKEILETKKNTENIKIIGKTRQQGIPHSMNTGVILAKYDYIIFCDQRQKLSDHILRYIVEPLKYKNAGAVSGCISHQDKECRCSLIRRYENFLKSTESKTGNLIGVYGPLYAIKKNCYFPIPDYIILDDLYLSLKILKTKQIEFRTDGQIIDDDFSGLCNYKRIKRYLTGFLQILKEKSLVSELSTQQKIMLIWHKYLRLFIPLFIFLSYLTTGFMTTRGTEYLTLFCILTTAGLLSVLPVLHKYHFNVKNLIRVNVLYFIGFIDIFIDKAILHKPPEGKSIINIPDPEIVNR